MLPFQSKEKGFLCNGIANPQWAEYRGMRGRRTGQFSHMSMEIWLISRALLLSPVQRPFTHFCQLNTWHGLHREPCYQRGFLVMEEWMDGGPKANSSHSAHCPSVAGACRKLGQAVNTREHSFALSSASGK